MAPTTRAVTVKFGDTFNLTAGVEMDMGNGWKRVTRALFQLDLVEVKDGEVMLNLHTTKFSELFRDGVMVDMTIQQG